MLTHSLSFFIVMNLWLTPFLQVKVSVQLILQVQVSVGTVLLAPSAVVMQATTSNGIIQVLRFYCNYGDNTFCYSYIGGSFCCSHAYDYLCCNYAVRNFCSTYASDSFCIEHVADNFYCIYAGGSLLQLCRWYFLQCTTVSVVKCRLLFLL